MAKCNDIPRAHGSLQAQAANRDAGDRCIRRWVEEPAAIRKARLELHSARTALAEWGEGLEGWEPSDEEWEDLGMDEEQAALQAPVRAAEAILAAALKLGESK